MKNVPDEIVVSGGHAVTLTEVTMAENRWFQFVATGDPVVFFGEDSPIAPHATGQPGAVVSVQLDGQASAAEFGDWTLDTLSVFCADPRHTVTYFAHPEMGRDVVETPDGMFGREPGRDLADAPTGLRDLLTDLVAFEPAALSTRTAEVLADPAWVRAPLTARLARLLYAAGCPTRVLCRERMDEFVDGVLAVLTHRLPARPVRLHITGHHPDRINSADSADSTAADEGLERQNIR